jgi:hypothetical protein
MERVCCYCRLTLGWVVCEPSMDGERSHGACDACMAIEMAALLAAEYTLEIGAAGEEPATQAATPDGDGAAAVKNATPSDEALRAPISSSLPAAGGADAPTPASRRGGLRTGPIENAPDGRTPIGK